MGEQRHPALDHGHGSGDHDGPPPQRRGPMTLLRVGSFQRNSMVLSLVMTAESQRLIVDDKGIRAVQADLPALKPGQQAAERFFVAATAFPIDEFAGVAIVSLPDPDFVALAGEEMPHLVHLDHDGNARLRLGTVLVNVAADPPQDRLRSRPEQTGNGPERQSMTIKTDCGTLGSIRCAKAVRLGELVAARSTPPSLLAQDMTGFHNTMTTASRTKGTFLHNLFHRQRDHPNLYGIDRYPVTPSVQDLVRICSQVSGHVFRRFEPTETAGEDGDEGYQNESDEACVRPVEDRIQPAIAAEPSEGSLDDPSDFGGNEFSFGAPHLGLDLDSKILPRGLQVFSLI